MNILYICRYFFIFQQTRKGLNVLPHANVSPWRVNLLTLQRNLSYTEKNVKK